jgi:hypothetical protein
MPGKKAYCSSNLTFRHKQRVAIFFEQKKRSGNIGLIELHDKEIESVCRNFEAK